jgi:hypothetical protein
MRSVVLFLRDAQPDEVERVLSDVYPRQARPWVGLAADGESVLYIGAPVVGNHAVDDEELIAAVITALGAPPSATLFADVSWRHPGHLEVREFAELLLRQFVGVAHDDYSSDLWTLEEVLHSTKDGRAFFHKSGGSPYPPTRCELLLALDRDFYQLLGEERAAVACAHPDCVRGAIQQSVLCRAHHFENIRGRACPFGGSSNKG